MRTPVYTDYFSIILTTDQDLIKDGVQSIDDEFLKWFVKNPSCEFVDVKKYHGVKTAIAEISAVSGNDDYNWKGRGDLRDYKIIIPKEEQNIVRLPPYYESKQETLEEVVNNFKKTDVYINEIKQEQERSYSEEDMIKFMQFIVSEEELENTSGVSIDTAKYFLNKFKNK